MQTKKSDLKISRSNMIQRKNQLLKKQKHCFFKKHNIEHIDYKDINRLTAHVNPHARMLSRRRTGFSAKAQRDFARATKRSRFMALMPYIQH